MWLFNTLVDAPIHADSELALRLNIISPRAQTGAADRTTCEGLLARPWVMSMPGYKERYWHCSKAGHMEHIKGGRRTGCEDENGPRSC